MTPRERRTRIRDLACLATRLASTHYPGRGSPGPIFEPCDDKAFRSAFVEANFDAPFVVADDADGTRFRVFGHSIGLIDHSGQVHLEIDARGPIGDLAAPRRPTGLLPHALGPSNTRGLGAYAFRHIHEHLLRAYQARSGQPLRYDYGRAGFSQSRERVLSGMAASAIQAFCARIDPEALLALRHAQLATRQHAEMVTRVTGPYRLEWIQAIRAYPALIKWAGDLSLPSTIIDTVESRAPLIPVLADHFGMSPAQVRRFRGITPQRAGPYPGREGIDLIVNLPPHLRPLSRRDWRVAADLAFGIKYRLDWCDGGIREDFVRSLFRNTRGPLSTLESLNRELEGVPDVLRALQPATTPRHHRALARLQTMTISQLATFTQKWHRQVQPITAAIRIERALSADPPPWTGAIHGKILSPIQGVLAVELTTLDELLDEGEQMDHCVGSYVDSCYNGDSRIVSLRCQSHGARSTLELGQQWVEDRVQVYVKQHCGIDNESPPISLDSAARMLVQQLNSTEMDWWDCLEHLIPRSTANVFRHRMQAWMFEALGIREDVALAE